MDAMSAVEALGALAQPSRLAVFRLLVQAGPQGRAAGDIAHEVGVPATTLSFHLTQLGHAGLVRSRRHGRSILYAADYARMQELLDFLMENCCQGSRCVPEAVEKKRSGARGKIGGRR
ncbi:MAG: transcriptional regulator [Acidobacteria bacterium]|nr:MAG: transcriptional regulator [Acidobacteriota bacterium]